MFYTNPLSYGFGFPSYGFGYGAADASATANAFSNSYAYSPVSSYFGYSPSYSSYSPSFHSFAPSFGYNDLSSYYSNWQNLAAQSSASALASMYNPITVNYSYNPQIQYTYSPTTNTNITNDIWTNLISNSGNTFSNDVRTNSFSNVGIPTPPPVHIPTPQPPVTQLPPTPQPPVLPPVPQPPVPQPPVPQPPVPQPPAPVGPNGSVAVFGDPILQNNLTGQRRDIALAQGQDINFIQDGTFSMTGQGYQGPNNGVGLGGLNVGFGNLLVYGSGEVPGVDIPGAVAGDIFARGNSGYNRIGNINAGQLTATNVNGYDLALANSVGGSAGKWLTFRNGTEGYDGAVALREWQPGSFGLDLNLAELRPDASNGATGFAPFISSLANPTAALPA